MIPKICVALDFDNPKEAIRIVKNLKGTVDFFKIGLQLYCEQGNSIVREIKELGADLFLDLKFFDIPNTVANACKAVTRLGIDIINVHALGGTEMLKAATEATREEAYKLNIKPPKVLGVTILTSIDSEILQRDIGIMGSAEENAIRLAELCKNIGLDGVVASPLEIKNIRNSCGMNFIIATPGIRPASSDKNDQKRISTPKKAAQDGADILVIGRPIYASANPKTIAEEIIRELNDKN